MCKISIYKTLGKGTTALMEKNWLIVALNQSDEVYATTHSYDIAIGLMPETRIEFIKELSDNIIMNYLTNAIKTPN